MESVKVHICILTSLLLGTGMFGGCPMRKISPALARKDKNEQLLKSLGVPVNPTLPLIESESEVRLRTPQEIARRAVVLYAVVRSATRQTLI